MNSLLPAIVAVVALSCGLFVIADKGFGRIGKSFLALCIGVFFWQVTWIFLLQIHDPQMARILVKLGYLLLLFLPTLLYQFLAEISERKEEHPWIWVSCGIATVLALIDLGAGLVTNGYYEYAWGFYPKAGPLHHVHLVHTSVVIARVLYIAWHQQSAASPDLRIRLRVCLASVFVLALGAVDYLCSYGVDFYPPGGAAVAICLAGLAVAVVRRDAMSPVTVAATVAHEMRTPLATIRMQANSLQQAMPDIRKLHELASAHGLLEAGTQVPDMQKLAKFAGGIIHQVDRSNVVIDLMLAASRMQRIDTSEFKHHSVHACVAEAVDGYPFQPRERDLVRVTVTKDFHFHGSDTLMVFVLFNLIKNSLYALKKAGKGSICIEVTADKEHCLLKFTDTGAGIPAATLPRIFQTFFTTKKSAGAGIGLAFCRQAITSFGGQMHCESVEGQYTTFILSFRATDPAASADAKPSSGTQWSGLTTLRAGLR